MSLWGREGLALPREDGPDWTPRYFSVMIDKGGKFCQLRELEMTNKADVFDLKVRKC